MEPKEIHDLIEIVSRSNVSALEIEREGFRIRLVKETPGPPAVVSATAAPAAAAPEPGAAEAAPSEVEAATEAGLFEQRTPFVGTFYAAPSPDSEPFVSIGSRVAKGQVLCIVEAMKLMNEIEAEIDGEIVEILAQNGQPVEYGEVLFRMRPA